MKLVLSILSLLGFGKSTPAKSNEIKLSAQEALEIDLKKRQILNYPVRKLTHEEYIQIPEALSKAQLRDCSLGSWFRCRPYEHLPDVKVVMQIVDGQNALVAQIGAPLSPPPRWGNRYRVEFVD